jgi:hypothetical protein
MKNPPAVADTVLDVKAQTPCGNFAGVTTTTYTITPDYVKQLLKNVEEVMSIAYASKPTPDYAKVEFSPVPPLKRDATRPAVYAALHGDEPIMPAPVRYGTVVDLLTEAWQLIADPKRVTFGRFAAFDSENDPLGYSVTAADPRATRFCSVGAMQRVAHKTYTEAQFNDAVRILDMAAAYRGYNSVPAMHDSNAHSYHRVETVWRDAITMAKQDEEKAKRFKRY